MKHLPTIAALLFLCAAPWACHHVTYIDDLDDSGTSDVDSDTDVDSDSNTDSDSDTDTGSGEIVVADTVDLSGGDVYTMASDGTHVFTGSFTSDDGVISYSVGANGELTQLSQVESGLEVRYLSVYSDTLYIGADSSIEDQVVFMAYTIAKDGTLEYKAENAFVGPVAGRASRIGGRVFAPSYKSDGDPAVNTGAIHILNADDFGIIDQVQTPGWAMETIVVEGYLLVSEAQGFFGIEVYDPFKMTKEGEVVVGDYIFFSKAISDKLYVGVENRLYIYDLGTLPSITQDDSIDFLPPTFPVDVSSIDPWLFVLGSNDGVLTYQTDNLSSPHSVFSLSFSPFAMTRVGDYLVVGGDDGLVSLDISGL